jgi:hypothetical protein
VSLTEAKPFFDDPLKFVDYVAGKLEKGPMLMKIPSFLSKRDRSIPATIPIESIEEGTIKKIVHAVVSTRFGNTLYIVDPYDVGRPETFNLGNEDQKLNYLMWLMSNGIADIIRHQNLPQNLETVTSIFNSTMNDPQTRKDMMEQEFNRAVSLFIRVPQAQPVEPKKRSQSVFNRELININKE